MIKLTMLFLYMGTPVGELHVTEIPNVETCHDVAFELEAQAADQNLDVLYTCAEELSA